MNKENQVKTSTIVIQRPTNHENHNSQKIAKYLLFILVVKPENKFNS